MTCEEKERDGSKGKEEYLRKGRSHAPHSVISKGRTTVRCPPPSKNEAHQRSTRTAECAPPLNCQ